MHTIKISITVDPINIHVKCVFKVLALFFFWARVVLVVVVAVFFQHKVAVFCFALFFKSSLKYLYISENLKFVFWK